MEAKHDLSDDVMFLFIQMCPGLLDKGCKDENYLPFMWWLTHLEELSLSWIQVERKLGTTETEKQTQPTGIIIIIVIILRLEKTEVKGESIVYEPCGDKS